jgi:hypothetical protein
MTLGSKFIASAIFSEKKGNFVSFVKRVNFKWKFMTKTNFKGIKGKGEETTANCLRGLWESA